MNYKYNIALDAMGGDNAPKKVVDMEKKKKNDIELNIHSFHKFWFILLITLIIEWFLRKRKGLL